MESEGIVRYLITGGAGFIGSHLADAYVARGHQVTILPADRFAGTAIQGRMAMGA